jgi:hypothetical protein
MQKMRLHRLFTGDTVSLIYRVSLLGYCCPYRDFCAIDFLPSLKGGVSREETDEITHFLHLEMRGVGDFVMVGPTDD